MSVGAPQPWPPPPTSFPSSSDNKSFRDCQPGICTLNCPQFCGYFFLQPPPPLIDSDDDSSSPRNISPLMAALIAVLAAAFLLLFYYTVISRLCRRRRGHRLRLLNPTPSDDLTIRADPMVQDPARPEAGLDEGYIRQITVFKYRRADGLVEGTECAVCLSEFKEEESLRLMPNCEHAFHIPCIDTWLKSNSSCPLCRSTMNPAPVPPAANQVSAMRAQRSHNPVLVVRELEGRGEVEVRVEVVELADEECGGSLVNSEDRERERKVEGNNRR